jgi:hypothetical protein
MFDTDRLRTIPLADVLGRFGLTGVTEGRSVAYRSDQFAINVSGQRWHDHKAGIGGHGAIDLAVHLLGRSFKETCSWLSELPVTPPAQKPDAPRLSFAEQLDVYAKRDDDAWTAARAYLVTTRCLDASLVDSLYGTGDVYANDRGGIVFMQKSIHGHAIGASVRGVRSHFHQSLGSKLTAWFAIGDIRTEAKVAVVESPIDALSYRALHPDAAVASVGGNFVPHPLLVHLAGRKAEPIIALDNDPSGDDGARRAESIWNQFQTGRPISRMKPTLKDWNEDLRRVRAIRITV